MRIVKFYRERPDGTFDHVRVQTTGAGPEVFRNNLRRGRTVAEAEVYMQRRGFSRRKPRNLTPDRILRVDA